MIQNKYILDKLWFILNLFEDIKISKFLYKFD